MRALFLLTLFPVHLFALLDTFGISQIYPSRQGTIEWTSAHWNGTPSRTIKYTDDDFDPTGWTEDHSSASDGFRIDGKGAMTMSGDGPRFHINSLDTLKHAPQFFRDIEYTAYYQRKGSNGKNWGGMVIGLRSGALGHASSGGDDCDATTYYARFRNDGKWDFEKELKHPGSTFWSASGYNRQDPLWNGQPLPLNRWIGMKFIIYNIDNNSKVKMELYIDSTSNGVPVSGGEWRKVGSVVDSGSWPSGDVVGCSYEQNSIILKGNGTILMRTDGDTAVYKSISIREIDPSTPTSSIGVRHQIRYYRPEQSVIASLSTLRFPEQHHIRIYSLDGRLLASVNPGTLPQFIHKRADGLSVIHRKVEENR